MAGSNDHETDVPNVIYLVEYCTVVLPLSRARALAGVGRLFMATLHMASACMQ